MSPDLLTVLEVPLEGLTDEERAQGAAAATVVYLDQAGIPIRFPAGSKMPPTGWATAEAHYRDANGVTVGHRTWRRPE